MYVIVCIYALIVILPPFYWIALLFLDLRLLHFYMFDALGTTVNIVVVSILRYLSYYVLNEVSFIYTCAVSDSVASLHPPLSPPVLVQCPCLVMFRSPVSMHRYQQRDPTSSHPRMSPAEESLRCSANGDLYGMCATSSCRIQGYNT